MFTYVPAQCSILSADALASYLTPRYDFAPPIECLFLQQGDNDTYLVRAASSRYVLRVYRYGKHSIKAIQAEVDILHALHSAGIPVAPAVPQRDGRTVLKLSAPEGRRYAVLFTFADGDLTGFQMTARQSYHYGQAVASLHQEAEHLSRFARQPLDLPCLLDQPLDQLRRFLQHRPADLYYLEVLSEALHERLRVLPTAAPAYGLCHGDLHKRNVLFTADDAPIILDFDCVGYGWRAYDLAVLLWSTALQGMGTNLWDAYLRGYETRRPLEPEERKAIPAFVAARHLWSWAWKLDGHSPEHAVLAF